MENYDKIYAKNRLADLQKDWKRLAKRADQRLVRLEKASSRSEYSGILTYSYRRAMQDIKAFGGQKAKRFNIKKPASIREAKMRIKALERFLESPTSTVAGVKKIYKKKAESLNKHYDMDITSYDLDKLIRSGIFDRLKTNYGSPIFMEIIATVQRDKEKIKKAMEEADKKDIEIFDTKSGKDLGYDKVLEETIVNELKSNGLSLIDLM